MEAFRIVQQCQIDQGVVTEQKIRIEQKIKNVPTITTSQVAQESQGTRALQINNQALKVARIDQTNTHYNLPKTGCQYFDPFEAFRPSFESLKTEKVTKESFNISFRGATRILQGLDGSASFNRITSPHEGTNFDNSTLSNSSKDFENSNSLEGYTAEFGSLDLYNSFQRYCAVGGFGPRTRISGLL